MLKTIVGIDLGTTNSCVSILKNNKPTIIPNQEGLRTTPSVVSYITDENNKDGDKKQNILVGENARNNILLAPTSTIYAAKRLIGRKLNDLELKPFISTLPYTLAENCKGDIRIKINNKMISPEEIGSKIISKLKSAAESFLKRKVDSAVITVPAYFDDAQRQATKNSARVAGIEVARVINEPTAAALAYGVDKDKNGIVAVYDLGGGTFDVSILELNDGVFEVKSTSGNTQLGGEDIDNQMIEYMTDKLSKHHKIDITDLKKNHDVMQRLKEAAEKAKKELSTASEAKITIPYLLFKENKPVHLNFTITQKEFEKISLPIINKTIEPCKKALQDANITPSAITHVILVGGMTRMPLVRKTVEKIFQRKPDTSINPDEAIAQGAAIQAGILQSTLPHLLLDVASLSLGIETLGGIFNKIIPRNTTLPTKHAQTFTTSEDNQTTVDINVYQGERPLVKYNRLLGQIKLKSIPPAPKNTPRIEVEFQADQNGIYTVTAKDLATETKQQMEIIPNSGLTEEEINNAIQRADENKEIDEKEAIDAELTVQ